MALVTTIEDVHSVLPVNIGSSDIATVLPLIVNAEQEYLPKILGNTVFNNLQAEYDLGVWTTDLVKLLPYVRKIAINMAYYNNFPIIAYQISDSGVYKQESEDAIPLKQWEYKELKSMLSKNGLKAIDELYRFLEKTPLDFTPDWVASDAYTEYKDYLITTTDQFQACVNIGGSRWTYVQLLPYIKDQEELVITNLIGADYLADIKAKIVNDTLTEYDKRTLAFVQKITANYAIVAAADQLSLQIDSTGITVLSSRGTETIDLREGASDSRIEAMKNTCTRAASQYIELLLSYLVKEASNMPIWYASEEYNALSTNTDLPLNTANINSKTSFFL